MDRSALTPIGPLPSRDAISKAPRVAGYRGSDFVLWHPFTVPAAVQTCPVTEEHRPKECRTPNAALTDTRCW